MQVNDKNRETWHTLIAVALFTVGASAAWYAMVLVPPYGEISGSVLGFVGETFTPAGGLLGIVNYTRYQIHRQDRHIQRLERHMRIEPEDEEEFDEQENIEEDNGRKRTEGSDSV